MPTDRVHIIWDNSNIFVSGKRVADRLEYKKQEFRIHFKNLIDLSAANRKIEQVFLVGSTPPLSDAVWGHVESLTGKKPELYERGAQSGKEQSLDQALQVRMLRLGYDYRPPETIVLLTGDGAGFETNVGFFSDIKRLFLDGWKIEILSWKDSCKKPMREWAEESGIFVDLEDYYSSITFLEKIRKAKELNLENRIIQLSEKHKT